MDDFDPDILFPPTRFIKIKDVPVFDEHENKGVNGKPRKITKEMLVKLARNCNKKFEEVGAATPLSLGHTIEGKPEEEQPPVVGWAVNFRVGPLLKTGRDALYCDWYIRKKHEDVIDEYPNRSIELWPSRLDISPIALLKSTAPERDLPILKYQSESPDEEPYRYIFSFPLKYERLETMDSEKDKQVMSDAEMGETSSVKDLAAQVGELNEKFDAFLQMFTQLIQGEEEGGEGEGDGEDLMKPEANPETTDKGATDKPVNMDSGNTEEEEPEPEEEPVKNNASMSGPDNVYNPTPETKEKMSRANNEQKVDYQKLVAEAVTKATSLLTEENKNIRAENKEIVKKFNRMQAEKAVATLESKPYNIDFGDDSEKETETQFFADLLTEDKSGNSFNHHFDKVAKKYKRKEDPKPDSKGAFEINRFSRTEDPAPTFQSADDVLAYVEAYTKDNSLTPEKYAASKNGVKK